MIHTPVIRTDLGHGRTARRWSPRLGYALAIGGSALVWGAVALVAMAVT